MRKRISQYIKEQSAITLILEIVFLFVCLYGIYKSCWMNTVGVSLWLDEAMLASSVSKRSIWNLTSEILEWTQSAPAGWLYLNKLITLVLGNTEFTLRIFSVFSYAATLFLLYDISKKYLHLRLPLLPSAYLATMSFALYYSIMFKPYISDGMFAMLTILAYYIYKEKKRRSWLLGIVWAVFVWFANPVCFVAGGLIISEILFTFFEDAGKIRKKEFKFTAFLSEIKPWLIISGIILASFVLHYLYWLRPVAVGDVMQNYWKGQNFPLFPHSAEDVDKLRAMKSEIFVHFAALAPFMILGLITTLIWGFYAKSRGIVGLYIGLLLMLFASYINRFPVEDRMWYYFYPLTTLLFFTGLDKILHFQHEKTGTASVIILAMIGICAVAGNNGFERFSSREKVFRPNEETNYEVEYVREHVKADEAVYVYRHSVPGFMYKNGYDTDTVGEHENKVIYGIRVFSEDIDYSGEIAKITETHHCYLVLSHLMGDETYGLRHELPELGWLELVRNDYSTPLLYWTDDLTHAKSEVRLSVVDRKEDNGLAGITVRIDNIGETILNSQFSRLRLVTSDGEYVYEDLEELGQGESAEIEMEIPAEYHSTLRLVDTTGKEISPHATIEF